MKIVFSTHAWEDYLYWQKYDRKITRKVNELIRSCQRTPFEGIGKPEALKENLSGWWSRRINHEHRLVYRIHNDQLQIAQCRKHY
ncbi:MAG: Txe/YoeB family addiction module toxin [Bacteroidota bacterium]